MEFNWKRLLKLDFEKKEVLGLDIGSSAVKLIQLRKDNGVYAVTAAGMVDIVVSEENKNLGEISTAKAINECLESAGIQTRLAVCSVCGPEVAVRDFKFPSLPSEEIEGAILLEASQVCPFSVDDSAVDYRLISDDDDETRGVLVAATNKLIERKVKLAEEASLSCVLMDVDGLALLNCFSECEVPEAVRTTAILNVGGSYTSLAILGDNDLPFVRDMGYAGNHIIKEIANENHLSVEDVRKILYGNASPDQPQSDLAKSLEKACQKLIADVTKTLRYYTAQEKAGSVEKIFVCGNFALVKGFVELLSRQLPASVVLWNPFDNMGCELAASRRDILAEGGPAMVVAAGLAMRSI